MMGSNLHKQRVASTVKLSHLDKSNISFVAHYPSFSLRIYILTQLCYPC